MKILITGARGQVGTELTRLAQERNYDALFYDIPEFDITDSDAVEKRLKETGPSIVINAAAYTAVDNAERKSERERVFEINRDGPLYLASSCAKIKAALIHISTDYVFNGLKKGPYSENDPVAPLGVYGTSKAAGETAVRQTLNEHVIVRTAWVYGIHGHNFVKTMLRLGSERETLRVVNDQYGCPTYAGDIAEALLHIASHINRGGSEKVWGTYHYCGEGPTTWYGFAQAIFESAQKFTSLKIKNLDPISTEEYPTPAVRPRNSVLNCSLISQTFHINPISWKKGLLTMIKALYSENG